MTKEANKQLHGIAIKSNKTGLITGRNVSITDSATGTNIPVCAVNLKIDRGIVRATLDVEVDELDLDHVEISDGSHELEEIKRVISEYYLTQNTWKNATSGAIDALTEIQNILGMSRGD